MAVRRRVALWLVALLALLSVAVGRASGASGFVPPSAYAWPIKPFDRQHPVRGNLGDPRTIFPELESAGGPGSPGAFSFHNGVDIVAPTGTAVYPVASGIAYPRHRDEVIVRTFDRRSFQYWHIFPTVHDDERVTARLTVLGYVMPEAGHVHLTEIDGLRVANPLGPGHLTPYRDSTVPRVRAILVRARSGRELDPLRVSGRVELIADAYDTPALPVPGPWHGLPVTPALVAWRLTALPGRTIVPETAVADFRRTEPPNGRFWQVYAAGTYQNFPAFGPRYFFGRAGRYLFDLTPRGLDTRALRNGRYLVSVTVADAAGNRSSRSERIVVRNAPRLDPERELVAQHAD